jgi:hypothetical protein|tara:strand:+ start:438 stop:635 length:198 start_codon:yes stop_codon:yes gene_type:complete
MKPEFVSLQSLYWMVFDQASDLMAVAEGLEPTSALKQCAFDNGIAEGSEMGAFVKWAHDVIDGKI